MADIKKIAEKLWKVAKKNLADARKYNKERKEGWRKSQMVEFTYEEDSTYVKDKGWVYNGCNIGINGQIFFKNVPFGDLYDINRELNSYIVKQKESKGWGGLNSIDERVSFDLYKNYTLITKLVLADAVCKEYNSLRNYIRKYGNYNLGDYTLYSVAKGGKRGRLWDEYGEREYLSNKPKKCARILEELRKVRGSKDTMRCYFGKEDYIDEVDYEYSVRHEIECEGEGRCYLKIEIKTPNGKTKYCEKIF